MWPLPSSISCISAKHMLSMLSQSEDIILVLVLKYIRISLVRVLCLIFLISPQWCMACVAFKDKLPQFVFCGAKYYSLTLILNLPECMFLRVI